MKIPHTIRADDNNWKDWISKNIGEKGKDYFWIHEPIQIETDSGILHTHNTFWEILDPRKAMLFALKFS